jgi:hypothetical protein
MLKWLQVYKLKVGLGDWDTFDRAVEEKFWAYDYRKFLQDLLSLEQEGSVEDYTKEFKVVQFHVSMFNSGFDDKFFTSHYANGLKDDIMNSVQNQLPDSVDKASVLARVQQQVLDRTKARTGKAVAAKPFAVPTNYDSSQVSFNGSMWKERQLRDYRCANKLCYFCGDKFDAIHLQKCPKRNKPQINALVINNLDMEEELTEETLNSLEVHDILTAEMGQLSLNAPSGTESSDDMRIRALVHNKVMLILVDSGSFHSFVSASFVQHARIQHSSAKSLRVRVANGEILISDKYIGTGMVGTGIHLLLVFFCTNKV